MAPGRMPGGKARASLEAPEQDMDDSHFMWRMGGVLLTVGAVIGAISLLLPHPETFDDGGLWSNVAVSFAAGLLCFLAAGRLPGWPLHLVLVLGTLIVTRAIYLSDDPSGPYTMFYIWIGIYAFLFFDWRAAIVQIAAIGAAYAWVLSELDAAGAPAKWTTVLGTLALGAFVIVALVRRLRRTVAESAILARERAGLMARLQEAANTDELTGLPNRRAWNHELVRLLAHARREATELSVAVLDLDHFKAYNDAHGHQAGDRLLEQLAEQWRPQLRSTDVLARYGGEEFAVALPACGREDARKLVERLRSVCGEGQTCSAGIAVWDGTEGPDELLRRADRALYAAKATGRDRVVAE